MLLDIGASSMFFVVLLSLRQDVDLETLFPMSVVALPVAIKQFFSDMRVRLPSFRVGYVRRFVMILALLFIQTSLLYGNKIFYLFGMENHFASSYYISKDVARLLKQKGIDAIKTSSRKLELALRFYGIKGSEEPYLMPVNNLNESYENEIPVIYLGKKVASFVIVPSVQSRPITTTQSRLRQKIESTKSQSGQSKD